MDSDLFISCDGNAPNFRAVDNQTNFGLVANAPNFGLIDYERKVAFVGVHVIK